MNKKLAREFVRRFAWLTGRFLSRFPVSEVHFLSQVTLFSVSFPLISLSRFPLVSRPKSDHLPTIEAPATLDHAFASHARIRAFTKGPNVRMPECWQVRMPEFP